MLDLARQAGRGPARRRGDSRGVLRDARGRRRRPRGAPAGGLSPEEAVPEETILEAFPAPEPQAQAPPPGPPVLLVDDEPEIRRVVGERLLVARASTSTSARPPDSARREMERLGAARGRFLLVTDLVLPSDSGAAFRGGLDLARHATGLAAPPPVLLMAEAIDEKLRARAKRLGVSLLAFKPGLSKLDPLQYEADLRAFGDKLARDLLPRLDGRRRGGRPAASAPPRGARRGRRARRPCARPSRRSGGAPTPTSSHSCCCARPGPSSRASSCSW